MAQLLVRNLEPELVAKLREQAARHRRSMEAEHREILRSALRPGGGPGRLKDLLLHMPDVGQDGDFERPASKPRRVKL